MKRIILFFEDDVELISLVTYILEKIDCNVISSNGKNFKDELKKNNPDLILLDHWLGGMLGSDICIETKENPSYSHIPIILISAVNGIDEIAASCKADDSITKPFDISDFEQTVLKWLGSSYTPNSESEPDRPTRGI